VVALSRQPAPRAWRPLPEPGALIWLQGDPSEHGLWLDEVARADAVIHLAGESIASGRWTARRKRELVASRVESTRLITSALAACDTPARVFICASAAGYYGFRGDEELREDAPPGDDFLARLCVDWEREALAAANERVRVVCLRLGVVLSRRGGALAKMLLPFRLGLGGPLGPAQNYFPWIHEDDAVGLIEFALARSGEPSAEHPLSGPVNLVAPRAIRMGEFAAALGRSLKRPALLPIPALALRVALGELADAVMPGQRVIPERGQAAGYCFRFPEIDSALEDCAAR